MSGYISDDLIEEIRLSNDIVDVVSEYVKLNKKGKVYSGLCPFHHEKTPSFFVVPTGQFFKCFGCQKGGNVFQFIKEAENLDFVEAVRLLAERVNIQLPDGESKEDKERARLKKKILEINTEAAKYFRTCLYDEKNKQVMQYLLNRGIHDSTIRRFGLGYSTDDWDALLKYLLGKGYNKNDIKNSGLIIPNRNGGYFDRFRARVMFPIFDILGNVIGFGGRVIDNSKPKYMNSPETLVYDKGRNLYALNYAKNSSDKRMIIVEGYMDVISLHQSGIINTVASLGTALTDNQGKRLKKYADEVIIAYDADTAGQTATLRGIDILDRLGCIVKILTVPDGKDPDEFIRKNGADEFRKLINNAAPLLEYKIRTLKATINTDTTEGKIQFLNKMADVLSKVDNNVEREMYVRKLAKEYQISEDSILSEIYRKVRPKSTFRKTVTGGTAAAVERKHQPIQAESKIVYYEKLLLAFLCVDNKLYQIVKGRVELDNFTDDANRKTAIHVFGKLEKGDSIVPAELLSLLDSEAAGEFSRIMMEECNCEDNTKAILDIINRIELFKLDNRQEEILSILNNKTEQVEGNVEKLKLELQTIIMKKKNIRNFS